MSGKGLKDEKQDLQKQIGCITGFFLQIFNRHHILTTQNTATSSIQQKAPSSGGTNNGIKEQNSTTQKKKAKNVKVAEEKQHFSTESSITSVSSSLCSSSMSSVEWNPVIQSETPSTSQIRIQQISHSKAAMTQKPIDFYDIVRDSIQREAQGLSVNTVAKKGQTYASKRIDSPRPLQPNKSLNAGVMVSNEQIHILSKPKRTPWDSPRLSYDGRYTQQDTHKSTTKHKELPRLSLDSKVRSIRGFDEGDKARNLLNGSQKRFGKNSSTMIDQQQEPDTSRRSSSPSSSVVARLMGLETLPALTQPCGEQLQASKGSDSDTKGSKSKSTLSVYGEIEKRLAELEFKKSGKDLRALKQILEAMQRFQDSPSENRNSNTSLGETSKEQSKRMRQKDLASVIVETSNSTQGKIKLPIVIMKPARITKNERLVDKQTAKGINSTPRNIKDPFVHPVPSNVIVTGSPRVQKKFGFERRSPPTSPSSDSSINRRQHNRQPRVELSSSTTTSRQNFSTLQDRNEHFNDYHRRNFKHLVNVISSDSGSNRSLESRSEEVTPIDQSINNNSNSIQPSGLNQNNTFEELRKESSNITKIGNAEQPSPISVLDAAFYKEDPPSPVKRKSNISKNLGEALSTDDNDSEENLVDLPPLSCITDANSSNGSTVDDMNPEDLAQMLHEIDWIDEKLVNFNISKNPDREYISEILFASGLLSGQSSSQTLQSHDHLINPKLFFAIEQMRTNKSHFHTEDSGRITISPDQMQRKLTFDVVNDILVKKLITERSSTLWFLPNELKGKQLLEEICTEIDQLQPKNRNVNEEDENFTSLLCEDLKNHHAIWTNCSREISNVVLDIERLIFKDLITEVVRES